MKKNKTMFLGIFIVFFITCFGLFVVNTRVTENLSSAYEYDGSKIFYEKDPFNIKLDFGDYYIEFDGGKFNAMKKEIINVFKND